MRMETAFTYATHHDSLDRDHPTRDRLRDPLKPLKIISFDHMES